MNELPMRLSVQYVFSLVRKPPKGFSVENEYFMTMTQEESKETAFERIKKLLEYRELVKLSVKVVVVIGIVPTLVWFAVITPLFFMGRLDMISGFIVLVFFYVGAFVLMPITILIIGDLLGAKRDVKKVAEKPFKMGQTDEYVGFMKDKEEKHEADKSNP